MRSFGYVRAFPSIDGWGAHLLASDRPLRVPGVEEIRAKLPPRALQDLAEYATNRDDPVQDVAQILRGAFETSSLLGRRKRILTDDTPVNEYYFVRQMRAAF